jgi:hypothetical protein
VRVEGYTDLNGDGGIGGEIRLFTTTTGNDGRFSVSSQPGCYVLRFTATGSGSIESGYESRAFCVGSGQTRGGLDTLLVTRRPERPMVCWGDGSYGDAGVAIVEWINPYGDEYFFYDSGGRLVARTSDLPNWVAGPSGGRRWASGYDAGRVASAARAVDGVQSTATECRD